MGKDPIPANERGALKVREAQPHNCFAHGSLLHTFCPSFGVAPTHYVVPREPTEGVGRWHPLVEQCHGGG